MTMLLITKGREDYLLMEFNGDSYYHLYWTEQYSLVFSFISVSALIGCILFLVSFLFSSKQVLPAKKTAYECGFDPYGEVKDTFKIQYYVVGILFMIFDVELAYLIPWSMYLGIISIYSFFIMLYFLFLLIMGLIYEWNKGALDWL